MSPELAEMREVNRALASGASLAQWRSSSDLPLEVDTITMQTYAGALAARVFCPAHPRAVYLETHGGTGWSGGSPAMCDAPNAELAVRCQIAVVAAEHRLAPAHPFPAGPDDCEAAAVWLLEHAPSEFSVDRLFIGGRTAGAHLAMVTALRIRDRHGAIECVAGLNLINGLFDLSMTPSQRQAGPGTLSPTATTLSACSTSFSPERPRNNAATRRSHRCTRM